MEEEVKYAVRADFAQRTDEWYTTRLGKLTASKAQAIGNCGKGLETLCWEKAAEILTGKGHEQLENADITRGIELEDEARGAYTLETGNLVEQVGFVEYGEYAGCSPDGLVNDDGGIEIKCKNDVNHIKLMVERKIDSGYMWQVQMNLLVTDRKWWDFVSYNPNFTDNPLIIIRVYPEKEMQDKLKEGIRIGAKRIKEILSEVEK